jgi:hypothetical protein
MESSLNSKLLRVKMDDEDKALRLILSLPSSYEHMKPILIHGKEKILFSEVTSKLLSEERRLSGGHNSTSENSALVVANWKKKKKPMKGNLVCWGAGNLDTLKEIAQKEEQVLQSAPKTLILLLSLLKEMMMFFDKGMYILWHDH